MERLTVASTLDSLAAIGKYVLAAAAAAGLPKAATYRLRLAVDEVATDIITHGYPQSGRQGTIDVQAALYEDSLAITLEDTAVAFDPRQRPVPEDLHLPPEQRKVGGLGVYLALTGVDRFHYERAGDRNRNVFVMNRPAP